MISIFILWVYLIIIIINRKTKELSLISQLLRFFSVYFNQTNTIINNFIYTTPSVKDKAKKKVNEEEFNSLEELLSALREESKLEISLNRIVIQKQ